MATEASIANLAAVRIGTAARVVSLDDDTKLSRTLKAVWDTERQATIRGGGWNFSVRRAALPALSDPGVIYPWASAFQLPADSLRLLEVLDLHSRDSYQIEGRRILCDASGPLYIRYAVDVTNVSEFDAEFAEAFACRLAWKCGHTIAGSAFDAVEAEREYRRAIAGAALADGIENPPIEQEAGSWIEARHGGAFRHDPLKLG